MMIQMFVMMTFSLILNLTDDKKCHEGTKDTNDFKDDKIFCAGTTRSRTHSSEKDERCCLYLKCPRNEPLISI